MHNHHITTRELRVPRLLHRPDCFMTVSQFNTLDVYWYRQPRVFRRLPSFLFLCFFSFCFNLYYVILVRSNNGLLTSHGICTCCMTSQWPQNRDNMIQKRSKRKKMTTIFISKSVFDVSVHHTLQSFLILGLFFVRISLHNLCGLPKSYILVKVLHCLCWSFI